MLFLFLIFKFVILNKALITYNLILFICVGKRKNLPCHQKKINAKLVRTLQLKA